MKLTCYLAAFAAFATLAAPGVAAGSAMDKAVALSAPDSKASLSAICKSVYDAVRESPEEADKVFSSVLSQRTTWKASEVYAIFRAVLLARPDLAGNLGDYVAAPKGGKNGKEVYTGSTNMDPMLYRLMNVLYEASLEDGVAEDAVNMLTMTITGVYEGAYIPTTENPNTNTNRVPDEEFGVIPTPGDMSKAN